MKIRQKKVRKFLSTKIHELNDVVADLDTLVTEMGSEYFRVSIFGSARIESDSKEYKKVYNLAKELASNGADIVTGGGPGLMEAANAGAKEGGSDAKSFGIRIELPFESGFNDHIDNKFNHKKFSSRLDEFMRLSHAVVVTPGGIGTLLEFFFAWQLMQVNHISARPIILVGSMWRGLIDWIKQNSLKKDLISKEDFDNIYVVDNIQEVTKMLKPHIEAFYKNKIDK